MKPILMETRLEAPLDRVWLAWTGSEMVSRWFSPEANIEARVGGPFELFFDPEDHSHMSTIGCVVTSISEKEGLGFNWKGPDQFASLMNEPEPATSVEVRFRVEGDVTVVEVEHSGWGDGDDWRDARDWHEVAWRGVLESLKTTLESHE